MRAPATMALSGAPGTRLRLGQPAHRCAASCACPVAHETGPSCRAAAPPFVLPPLSSRRARSAALFVAPSASATAAPADGAAFGATAAELSLPRAEPPLPPLADPPPEDAAGADLMGDVGAAAGGGAEGGVARPAGPRPWCPMVRPDGSVCGRRSRRDWSLPEGHEAAGYGGACEACVAVVNAAHGCSPAQALANALISVVPGAVLTKPAKGSLVPPDAAAGGAAGGEGGAPAFPPWCPVVRPDGSVCGRRSRNDWSLPEGHEAAGYGGACDACINVVHAAHGCWPGQALANALISVVPGAVLLKPGHGTGPYAGLRVRVRGTQVLKDEAARLRNNELRRDTSAAKKAAALEETLRVMSTFGLDQESEQQMAEAAEQMVDLILECACTARVPPQTLDARRTAWARPWRAYTRAPRAQRSTTTSSSTSASPTPRACGLSSAKTRKRTSARCVACDWRLALAACADRAPLQAVLFYQCFEMTGVTGPKLSGRSGAPMDVAELHVRRAEQVMGGVGKDPIRPDRDTHDTRSGHARLEGRPVFYGVMRPDGVTCGNGGSAPRAPDTAGWAVGMLVGRGTALGVASAAVCGAPLQRAPLSDPMGGMILSAVPVPSFGEVPLTIREMGGWDAFTGALEAMHMRGDRLVRSGETGRWDAQRGDWVHVDVPGVHLAPAHHMDEQVRHRAVARRGAARQAADASAALPHSRRRSGAPRRTPPCSSSTSARRCVPRALGDGAKGGRRAAAGNSSARAWVWRRHQGALTRRVATAGQAQARAPVAHAHARVRGAGARRLAADARGARGGAGLGRGGFRQHGRGWHQEQGPAPQLSAPAGRGAGGARLGAAAAAWGRAGAQHPRTSALLCEGTSRIVGVRAPAAAAGAGSAHAARAARARGGTAQLLSLCTPEAGLFTALLRPYPPRRGPPRAGTSPRRRWRAAARGPQAQQRVVRRAEWLLSSTPFAQPPPPPRRGAGGCGPAAVTQVALAAAPR